MGSSMIRLSAILSCFKLYFFLESLEIVLASDDALEYALKVLPGGAIVSAGTVYLHPFSPDSPDIFVERGWMQSPQDLKNMDRVLIILQPTSTL